MKEILILPAMSDFERQKVEGYLAHAIGFRDHLPIEHPYLNLPFTMDPNGVLRTSKNV